MSAGTLIVIGLLGAAFGGFIRIWTKTTPEDPPDVTIRRYTNKWHYILDDSRGMASTGYITRNAAIRAAQQELDRLHAKDETTQ